MKNNELFTVKPSLKQFYGRTVTKDTQFDESTENGEIRQILKSLELTTTVKKTWKQGDIECTLESTLKERMPEGTVLIWNEGDGYIIPNVPMYKLSDLEKEIEQVKEIYKDNTDINPVDGTK